MILFIVLLISTISAKLYVDPENRVLRDEHGRQTILHGFNAVYKIHPYIPGDGEFDSQNSLNDQDIDFLKTNGFNFIRLGVMWEAVETAPGVYNQTYLDAVDNLITKLGIAGIHTMVDAHQDVLARVICGEGMPNFYAKQVIAAASGSDGRPYCFGKWLDPFMVPLAKKLGECKSFQEYDYKTDEDGNPLVEECQKINFATYYSTTESMALFHAFYENDLGIQDKFVAFWDVVSKRLSKNEFVIGYDPLNEPTPSSIWRDPTLKLPKRFDRAQLTPLYEKIFEKYKDNRAAKDEPNIMFFEPAQWPDFSKKSWLYPNGSVHDLGFKTPPGGQIGSTSHVLNDHSYCCQLSDEVCATGEPAADMGQECLAWHFKRISTRADDARKLGVPLIISEFGACLDSDECVREISQVAEACDDMIYHVSGWAYWQFKTYKDLTTSAGNKSEGLWNKDGSLQQGKLQALTRPYARYAQGYIIYQGVQQDGKGFEVDIYVDTSIDEPTELMLHRDHWFPDGFAITAGDSTEAHYLKEGTDYVLGKTHDDNLATIKFINHDLDGHEVAIYVKHLYSEETNQAIIQ